MSLLQLSAPIAPEGYGTLISNWRGPDGMRTKVGFAVAEIVHRETSEDADAARIDEFFKAILASKALKADEKKEIETLARVSAEYHSVLDMAQNAAAHQARKIYKCTVCGLEFIGILSFTEHNEETSHMRDQGRIW